MRGRRMFIAVDPSAELAGRARAVIDGLRATGVEAAWTNPAQLHLTIHFLGDEVDDSDLHRICVAMDEAVAGIPAFRVAFGGVGVFPDMRRPRVLWLGVLEGSAELARLHDALAVRLTPLGFPPEARGYQPHLTLGRFRAGGRGRAGHDGEQLAAAIEACGEIDAGASDVRRVCLYESHLAREGARYDRLHAASLGR
jgi:2'-5' RNA ligase